MLASGAYYIMIFEFSRAFCAESIHRQKISYAMMLQHHSRLLKNGKNSAKTKFNYFFNFDDPFDLWLPKVGIILIVLYSNCLHTKKYYVFCNKNLHFFPNFAHCAYSDVRS